jgi:hypothetical protein
MSLPPALQFATFKQLPPLHGPADEAVFLIDKFLVEAEETLSRLLEPAARDEVLLRPERFAVVRVAEDRSSRSWEMHADILALIMLCIELLRADLEGRGSALTIFVLDPILSDSLSHAALECIAPKGSA